MNPSYSSGPSNSGGQPGIVASGPDSSLPQGAEGTGNGRSGGFNFNNFINNIPKKWLAIGAGVLVVILIIVVVAMGMGGKKSDGNNGTQKKITNSPTYINKVINYIKDGTDSDKDINDSYDAAATYYFLSGWNNMEEKKAIYDKTKALMDEFVDNYKNGGDEVSDNVMKNTKDLFDLIYILDLKEKISTAVIKPIVIKDGRDSAKKQTLEYYDLSQLKDNTYASSFSEAYNAWVNSLFGGSGNSNELYRAVSRYFKKDRSFIANVYDINDLIHGRNNRNE